MSRRSLKKIDPALDISGHLILPEQIPQPWDGMALFGRAAPLEVEVGSGKGLFLSQAALARPEHNFLGVEIAAKYAHFIAARLAKRKLANARILHGDAERLLAEILPADSLSAVHVYFPDPWWKKRHRKRRVMNQRFLADVQRVLKSNGTLHFWTDVEEYFQSTLELITTSTQLTGPFAVDERAAEHDLDFHTHFERRMRLHGEPVYRAIFCKANS